MQEHINTVTGNAGYFNYNAGGSGSGNTTKNTTAGYYVRAIRSF